ncbi:replication/maintenance protein RepL [Burkholderia territorii]|uniref:replication/maintenance protein RepL n=1 Tax=Burkholderia territorii TaxID=1503055 RepID=UPI0018C78466|nr:replication/maintenance protein RepL [Burkholderia territorii]
MAIQQPSAIAVLFFLMSRTNRGSNAVLMSHAAIAQCMDIAERTVRNAIDTLKAANFIRISKSGKSNVYELNSRTSWQGKRGARHASFSAEVTVIEKEQNIPVDDLIKDAENFPQLPFMDDDGSDVFSPT